VYADWHWRYLQRTDTAAQFFGAMPLCAFFATRSDFQECKPNVEWGDTAVRIRVFWSPILIRFYVTNCIHRISPMSQTAVWTAISNLTDMGLKNMCAFLLVLLFLSAFEKWRKLTISFVISVRPYGTTQFPLGGFLLNLKFEHF